MDLQRWVRDETTVDDGLARWFTAFPSGWWTSVLGDGRLTLRVSCDGPWRLISSNADGSSRTLHDAVGTSEISGIDAGASEWLWLDADGQGSLQEVVWSIDDEVVLPGVIAVVPTFGRENDATHQAATFLACDLVHRVVVIDQGGTLRDHPPFQALVRENPDRLVLREQRNLGGSGGYARGMIESLDHPDCAVLLSDDDAALPEESLRRMLAAQVLAARRGVRLVMATPMFSAETPRLLISAAERVRPRDFQWGAVDGLRDPISVGCPRGELADALRITAPPNYAGWWGALLPPRMVADVGLPAPYFLKWDDSEFGLRAVAKGYEFMALPGTGVWHPTWGAHKTLTTWVAVLLHRNRLTTASAYGVGRGVIRDSFVHQVKHVLSLQYDVAELWSAGIDQFLEGPGWLGSDLADARVNAQAVVDGLPPRRTPSDSPAERRSLGTVSGIALGATGMVRKRSQRESSCPADEFTWRDGLGMDRVVLTDEAGTATELLRDPRRARSILRTAIRQHAAMARRWRALSPRYRDALSGSVTLDRWIDMLGIQPK